MSLNESVALVSVLAKLWVGLMAFISLGIGIFQKDDIKALKYMTFSLFFMIMFLISLEVIP